MRFLLLVTLVAITSFGYGQNNIKTVAHRGASKFAPENTIPAIEKAIALSADFAEIDVRQTKDGVFVLMHDATINRTTNGAGKLSDLNYADLQGLDAGSWFSSEFTGTKVPTLEEILEVMRGKIHPDIDFKSGDVPQLVALLERKGFLNGHTTFYAGDKTYIAQMRSLTDSVLVRPSASGEMAAFQQQYNPQIINISRANINETYIEVVHNLGMKAFVNCLRTKDKKKFMKRAIAYGADYIQADNLDVLLPLVEAHNNAQKELTVFNIQGHRGCRGYFPENSVYGFVHAAKMGVTTLEMDVVISADSVVVVSHEPFLNADICLDANGMEIPKLREKEYNLYQMTYDSIQQCDCGSKGHEGFPDQVALESYKPSLSEVISRVEFYLEKNNLPPIQYNIETKLQPETDGIYHPGPAIFVDLLMEVIATHGIENRTTIQSFDSRTLEIVHEAYPEVKTAFLTTAVIWKIKLEKLGFQPAILSPNYMLVDQRMVHYCKTNNIQLIPWTVNNPSDIKQMIELGVDGIISDYPGRVMEVK